jgi:hypothetical protein
VSPPRHQRSSHPFDYDSGRRQRPMASFAPVSTPVPTPVSQTIGREASGNPAARVRQQHMETLRQYSSMAVERARDPWLAADTEAAMRANLLANDLHDEQPAYATQQAQNSHTSRSMRSASRHGEQYHAGRERYLAGPTSSALEAFDEALNEPTRNPRSSERVFQASSSAPSPQNVDVISARSDSPGPPPLERSSSPMHPHDLYELDLAAKAQEAEAEAKRPKPMKNEMYCRKCRRHFQNNYRLLMHMQDSVIHPYYCRSCTVDWPTFGELHLVRPFQFDYA